MLHNSNWRNRRNWGIKGGSVADLFDHNYCFGGPAPIVDCHNFMKTVTTPFYVSDENKQRHDTLLKYLVKYHMAEVVFFSEKLTAIKRVNVTELMLRFPDCCRRLNGVLMERVKYTRRKVGEYSAGQIDDNEF